LLHVQEENQLHHNSVEQEPEAFEELEVVDKLEPSVVVAEPAEDCIQPLFQGNNQVAVVVILEVEQVVAGVVAEAEPEVAEPEAEQLQPEPAVPASGQVFFCGFLQAHCPFLTLP